MGAFFTKVFDASGILHNGPCTVVEVLCGNMDGVNDPRLSLHNSTDNSGDEYIPENPLNASQSGFNGLTRAFKQYFSTACYVEIEDQQLRVSVCWRPGM